MPSGLKSAWFAPLSWVNRWPRCWPVAESYTVACSRKAATANEALSGLRTKQIDEHIRHADGVVEVKYEDGTSVYVNYNDKPVTVNGVQVAAKNFTVGGESK